MNSTVCPKCKQPVRPGARFCGNCGYVLQPGAAAPQQPVRPPQPPVQPPVQPPMQQRPAGQVSTPVTPYPTPPQPVQPQVAQQQDGTKQGKKNKKQAAGKLVPGKCPKCGTQNRPNATFCSNCGAQIPQVTPPSPQSGPKRWPLIALIVVLALAIVGLGFYIATNWTKLTQSSTPVPTTVVQATAPVETKVSGGQATAEPTSTKAKPTTAPTVQETTAVPTKQAEPTKEQAKPTEPPTVQPTNSPEPTKASAPAKLFEEIFSGKLADRWNWSSKTSLPVPLLVADPKSIELKGGTLDDTLYTKDQIKVEKGISITLKVNPDDTSSMAFRWDTVPMDKLPAFKNARYSLVFDKGNVKITSGGSSTTCNSAYVVGKPVVVKIELTDKKASLKIDGAAPAVGCVNELDQNEMTGKQKAGYLSFAGSGSIQQVEVIAKP